MVSKGLLLALAVCALSGFSSCATPALHFFDPCVKVFAQIKSTFDLSFDLGTKICDIFRLVGSARKFIIKTIGGFISGKVSQANKHIPLPKNLGSSLETLYTGLKLVDLALQKRFGDVFTEKRTPCSSLCPFLWRRVLDFDDTEYGKEYKWLEDVTVNYLEVYKEFEFLEGLDEKKLEAYDSDEVKEVLKLATLMIKEFELIKKERELALMGDGITLAISAVVGFSKACGSKEAALIQAVSVYEATFKKYLPKKYGSVKVKDIQRDYKSFCKGCVKKTEINESREK